MTRFVVIDGGEGNWARPYDTHAEALKFVTNYLFANVPEFARRRNLQSATIEQLEELMHDLELYGQVYINHYENTYQVNIREHVCMCISEEGSQGVFLGFDSGSRCVYADAYNGQSDEEIGSAGDPVLFPTNSTPSGEIWQR